MNSLLLNDHVHNKDMPCLKQEQAEDVLLPVNIIPPFHHKKANLTRKLFNIFLTLPSGKVGPAQLEFQN